MPRRKQRLVTGEIYHVYNQGVGKMPVFTNKREYRRGLQALRFCRYDQQWIGLARFLNSGTSQLGFLQKIQESDELVRVLAYSLMPNHFHLVLEQLVDEGVSKYVGQFTNSYTKYFNARHERRGSLLLNPFKAVWIESDEQLLHVVRYVHLNELSAGVVKSMEELVASENNSLKCYLEGVDDFLISTELVTGMIESVEDHRNFVIDRADYQRQLEWIKHMKLEG